MAASRVASRSGIQKLTVVVGDEPPAEFQIFTAGLVETVKGTFVFDRAAADAVMAEYHAHAIDLMIDYDHASLDTGVDPALSGKAAGWFNLELRNGALWAVNVRWCPPAADALRRKEWRFMSPAFEVSGDRIVAVMNVAITNLPATRRLSPLMAASVTATGESNMLSAETLKEALDALIAGDEAKCMELLKGIVIEAASGDPDAGTEDAPPPLGDGGADEAVEMSKPPAGDKQAEVMAASARLMRLSGKTSIVESVADAEVWRASHVRLEAETQKLAAERAVLESAERRKLCVEMVTQGGRAPATIWANDESTAVKPYLAAMPIADLRSMHADAVKANRGKTQELKPPASTGSESMTEREIALCSAKNIDPAKYAATKTRMGKA